MFLVIQNISKTRLTCIVDFDDKCKYFLKTWHLENPNPGRQTSKYNFF